MNSIRSLATQAYKLGPVASQVRPSARNMMAEASVAAKEHVLFSKAPFQRNITLNREKALHALNLGMVRSIQKHLKMWEPLDNVQVVVIDSVGQKAFCAGGDIAQLHRDAQKDETRGQALQFFEEEYEMNYTLGMYKKPIVSLIKGITMGGGVGLSVHGSLRIATDTTMFAMPETGIGFFPDVGGGSFLSRLDETASVGRGEKHNALGMYLGLTGERLKGADNFHFGIATHYLEPDAFSRAQDVIDSLLVMELNQSNPLELNRALHEAFADQMFLVPECTLPIDAIYECFDNASSVEEICKRVESVASADGPNAGWASRTLKHLQSASPTSLKVTFRLINEGRKFEFAENFKREYRVASKFMQCHDFFEGVDAKVISKSNTPKWKPESLEGVTEQFVDDFFAPLGKKEFSKPLDGSSVRLNKFTDTRKASDRRRTKKARAFY